MWRSLVARILLIVSLFMSAPRDTFWHDVSLLRHGLVYDDEYLWDSINKYPVGGGSTAFTEFYVVPSVGSNLNGGSDGGTPSMSDTAGTGGWVSGTGVYTSGATTGTVTVGQFMSIYSSGATIPAYTSRITAVSGGSGSSWVITLSSTAIAGALPTTGATYFGKVGGAWAGPATTVGFPFGYATSTLTNASGNYPRVSFSNATTYNVSAAMTHSLAGPIYFQGMTSTPGDLGKATISGGSSGASFVALTLSGASNVLRDLAFLNNGATGSANLLSVSGNGCLIERVVTAGGVASGLSISNEILCVECEAYGNNTSNTASKAGIITTFPVHFRRCISSHNAGSNTDGFRVTNGAPTVFDECIADSNGKNGIEIASTGIYSVTNCVLNGNAAAGLACGTSVNTLTFVENSLLVGNGAYGVVANSTTTGITRISNCAYYNNTSGQTNGTTDETGPITLTGNPFVAPSTGNFALNTTAGAGAACLAAGRGSFTQTYSGYTTPTVSTPNVGAWEQNSNSGPVGQQCS